MSNEPIDIAATQYDGVLKEIINTTSSELILGLIVIAIIGVLVGIPVYKLYIKKSNAVINANLEDKKLLVDVVKSNTEAIESLKVSLNMSNTTTMSMLQTIQNNTTKTLTQITEMNMNQDRLVQSVDKALGLTADIKNVAKSTEKTIENVNDKIETINHDHIKITGLLDQKK